MGLLVDGQWVDQWYEKDEEGRFVRPETAFREQVRRDGSTPYAPAAGRYHLYVSYACPWAHRTLIAREICGLRDAIGVTVVDPRMGEHGWEITGEGLFADPIHGAKFLHQVYTAAEPKFTGRVTVPVLWDKQTGTIVNNESREILRMFTHELVDVGNRAHFVESDDQRAAIDDVIDEIYEPVNNGVYRAGFADSQSAYEQAVGELFDALERWDGHLADRRFLCGDTLSEADICMFTTLVRFDPVYAYHFKCNVRRLDDYEHLFGFLKELYQRPAFGETTFFDHIKEHYYWSHPTINPKRIVPVGPEIRLDGAHGRERFSS